MTARERIRRGVLCARGLHDEWVRNGPRLACYPCKAAYNAEYTQRWRSLQRPEWAKGMHIDGITAAALEHLDMFGPLSQQTLADELGAEVRTVRRLLYRLKGKGLVYRNGGGYWWAAPHIDMGWMQ